MAESHWDEKTIFLQALGLPREEREAFLLKACPDEQSRLRVQTLLDHHAAAPDEFLTVEMKLDEADSEFPKQIDEFKLIHRLGDGGMGVVYLAQDTILGRRVALKILARHLIGSEQALARFRDEARSTAALKHPAIVPVFKMGRDGADHYLVSEYVEGRTLADVISERKRMVGSAQSLDARDWHRRAAEIVATIADALDCAHRAQIVHRDVKPSNILIDREHGPRLTDFGIAKHMVEGDRTQTSLVGSCHYMSPEQADIAGKRIDQRSDIFSLGVVLYELLVLQLPFNGSTLHQVLKAVIECAPSRLRTLDRRIPADLEVISHKALEKRPQDRYPTAAHIAADLRCFLAGDPILAKAPSLARRVRRFAHRRRAWIPVLLACVVVVIAAMAWFERSAHERELKCLVSVTSDVPNAKLLIRQFEPGTGEPGAISDLGLLPQTPLLAPGQYRLVAMNPDGIFSEATLLITHPGGEQRVNFASPPMQLDSANMKFFSGGDVTCGEAGRRGISALRTVQLRPFQIDVFEVSNKDYKHFVDVTGVAAPQHWIDFQYDPALADHPIVGISWEDANAYCRFVNKRLPTAAEWEYAMRFPDGRLQPWGDESPTDVAELCCHPDGRMRSPSLRIRYDEYAKRSVAVQSHDILKTASGLFHGATNVSEYTDYVGAGPTFQTLCKGASWSDSPMEDNLAVSWTRPLQTLDEAGTSRPAWSMSVGFRCARSAQP
ncbi:MAG: protein kinase [Planctomycetes bacterium]|nr:protein kinase [Planctomycetota bacterium]